MLPIVLPLALSIACKNGGQDSQGPDDTGALPCPGNRPYETFFPDADADGYGVTDEPLEACQPAPKGYTFRPDDCDDTNVDAHPGQQEDCATAWDDDCDGTINLPAGVNLLNCTDFFVDTDTDGFGNAGDSLCLCDPDKTHTASAPGDCDDRDPKVHLGTPTCVALEEKVWTARVEGAEIGEYVFAAELDEVAGGEIVLGSPDANDDAGVFFLLPGTVSGTIDLEKKGAPVIRIEGAKDAHLGTALAGPARLVGTDLQVVLEASGGLLVVAASDFAKGVIASPLATITDANLPVVLPDDDTDADSLAQLLALCETCGVKGEGEVYVISEPPAGTNAAGDLAAARISGTLDGELERAALADAGDMNGDGFRDIAIGAPESAGGSGAAYVFLGPQAPGATLTEADAVLSPDKFDLDLGWELAGPADYDDDGYDDLAVGSKRHGMNGGVFVMSGPPSSAKSGVDADAIIRGHPGDGHGFSMSVMRTAGADALAIGAPSAAFAAHDAGTVTVLAGPLSGLYYTQTDGVSLVQTEETSGFGSALAATADTNLLVGARGSDEVYVVPETAFGL